MIEDSGPLWGGTTHWPKTPLTDRPRSALTVTEAVFEKAAKIAESHANNRCGGWEPPEKRGEYYRDHYPDPHWAWCDGCTQASGADLTARLIASEIREAAKK